MVGRDNQARPLVTVKTEGHPEPRTLGDIEAKARQKADNTLRNSEKKKPDFFSLESGLFLISLPVKPVAKRRAFPEVRLKCRAIRPGRHVLLH